MTSVALCRAKHNESYNAGYSHSFFRLAAGSGTALWRYVQLANRSSELKEPSAKYFYVLSDVLCSCRLCRPGKRVKQGFPIRLAAAPTLQFSYGLQASYSTYVRIGASNLSTPLAYTTIVICISLVHTNVCNNRCLVHISFSSLLSCSKFLPLTSSLPIPFAGS